MATWILNRAITTAAVVAMAAAAFPHAAMAEPAPAPPPAVSVPADLVEALDRDLGITAQEFLAWSDAARILAVAASELRRAFPAVFGGAWLDKGQPTVGIAGTGGPDADRERQELRDAVAGLGLNAKDVVKSEAQLRSELLGLQEWVATLPPPMAAAFRGAIVDLANNQMVIGLAQSHFGGAFDLPDMLRSARILFSRANEIVPDREVDTVPIPSTDTTVDPGVVTPDQVQGGDAFLVGSARGQFRCSLGFNATGAGGEVVNITAGHCNPDGDGAVGNPVTFLGGQEAGVRFGTFAKTRLKDIDYGVVRVEDGFEHRFHSASVRGSGVSITGTADPVVGMPVCKSGVTTGYSCGLVTSTNLRVDIGERRLVNGFTASICALQGDSGGAIVSGTSAVGISSASDVGDYRNCAEAYSYTGLFGETPQLYGVPINDILAENPGLKLRTG